MMPPTNAAALLRVLALAAGKGAGVLAVAALLALALRRASAALRHFVWTLAIAVALLLPPAAVVLPVWRVAVLPAPVVVPMKVIEPPGVPITPAGTVAIDRPVPRLSFVPQEPSMREPKSIGEDRAAVPPAVTAPVTVAPRPLRPHWPPILLGIWATGTMAVLSTWVVGTLAAWRLGRRSPVVSTGPLFDTADGLRRELGIGRRVVLHVGGPAAMPVTWGTVRPHLALPADAPDWPAERLRAVLLHELSHVRRLDCATQLLAHLCCSVHWFDPMAWYAARRLRAERERACDDAVLRCGADPAGYAELLLDAASDLRGGGGLAVVAMARRGGLRVRVATILNGTVDRRPVARRFATAAATAAAALLLAVAAVRLIPRPVHAQAPATTRPAAPSIAATAATRPAAATPDRPSLRFLAWQAGDKYDLNHPPAPWRADGRPTTEADIAQCHWWVRPTAIDNSGTTHPPYGVLYLWFTDPKLDTRSAVSVDVVDGRGRSLQVAGVSPGSGGSSVTVQGDGTQADSRWAVVAACLPLGDGRPTTGTIRFTYTSGDWTDGSPLTTDTPSTVSEVMVGGKIIYTANGQDKDGHAFVTLVQTGNPPAMQRSFSARLRNGQTLPSTSATAAGADDVLMTRFAFDAPLSAVAAFIPQTRTVRTVTFNDVPLAVGVVRPTSRPATKPAAVAATAGTTESVDALAKKLDHDILQRTKPDLRRATVARVRAMLAGDDPVVQAAALTTVWHTGEVPYDRTGLAPVVVRLLGSPSAAVRRAALGALYAVKPDPVVARPAVERLADDPVASVRSQVIGGLLGLQVYDLAHPAEPIGAPALKLLGDPDRDVVIDTAQRLWGVEVTPEVERKVIELSRWPADGPVPEAKSIPYWMMYFVLSTRQPTVSLPVAERLAELASDPRLDENWHYRCIWGLGNHEASPAARDVIVKALVSEVDNSINDQDRYWAVLGLGRIGTPAALARVRAVAEGEESQQLKELARRYVPTTRP